MDEVDRTLDMGFRDEVGQIVRNIPRRQVQALVLSATADGKVKEFAEELLDKQLQFFNIHEGEAASDKGRITHLYMEVTVDKKLDTIFSFIKAHQRSKCIFFFSSCK